MSSKLLLLSALVALAHGHGYLKEPIARTSIQEREAEFGTSQPYWWDNRGVWCGNEHQNTQYSTCGRCGDSPGQTTANQGGIYDKNVIVATYQSGSIVDFEVVYTGAHYGHFELEICPQQTETDGCFQKLQVVSAVIAGTQQEIRGGTKVCVPHDNEMQQLGPVSARVQLPAGVRCDRCTIRWTHRTSYPGRPDWDNCDNPNPTQTFRNCADVRIQ